MCCQFYEHFFSSFCANFLLSKKSQSQTVSRKRLRKTLFVQKAVSKFLGAIETWCASNSRIKFNCLAKMNTFDCKQRVAKKIFERKGKTVFSINSEAFLWQTTKWAYLLLTFTAHYNINNNSNINNNNNNSNKTQYQFYFVLEKIS